MKSQSVAWVVVAALGVLLPVISLESWRWVKKARFIIGPSLVLSGTLSGLPPMGARAAEIQDQIKVIQALQVEKQIDSVQKQKKMQLSAVAKGSEVIASGIIALPPPPGSGIDPSQYPLGFSKAGMVDNRFDDKKASLIITAVPRNGPPFAAKIIRDLSSRSFPLAFSITSEDLLFPYTAEAWASSQYSKDSIAITAILDDDGLLETPGESTRFGFAIAQVTKKTQNEIKDGILNSGAGVGEGATFVTNAKTGKPAVEEVDLPSADAYKKSVDTSLTPVMRREAKISISLRAEGGIGNQYSEDEVDLLRSLDKQLRSR